MANVAAGGLTARYAAATRFASWTRRGRSAWTIGTGMGLWCRT